MPIVAMERVRIDDPETMEQKIGRALFMDCMRQFVHVLGQPGLGISYDSCNAAVAIDTRGDYEFVGINHEGQQVDFSVVYGSSRLFTGLDPDFNAFHAPDLTRPFSSSLNGEHAEQSAIRTASHRNLPFFQHGGVCHIYIDLTPCSGCEAWLNARPENWYVHYFADLADSVEASREKKHLRAAEFGRQMEPSSKKTKK